MEQPPEGYTFHHSERYADPPGVRRGGWYVEVFKAGPGEYWARRRWHNDKN